MSLADLVIPLWVRIAACATVVGLIFGAGYRTGGWVSDNRNAAKIATAERGRDKAQNDLAAYRLQVREAAAEQATGAAQQTIKQATITQESAHAYINHRGTLEQRIAAGGLRTGTNQGSPGGCRLGAVAATAGRTADAPAQSVPAGTGGTAGALSLRMDEALRDKVIDNAALDAQQLAELIDAACRQGLCPAPER